MPSAAPRRRGGAPRADEAPYEGNHRSARKKKKKKKNAGSYMFEVFRDVFLGVV